MRLLTTKEFNGVALDCYKAENENDGFWATREQIGRLLGYKNPADSIAKIHNRHKENLDRYSGMDKLSTPEGGTQETVIYNFKGFLEICRYSNQPKAEAVIRFCWDVMDEIRKHGMYLSEGMMEQIIDNPVVFEQVAVGYINSRLPASDKNSLMVLGYAVHLNRTLFIVKEAANILRQFGLQIGEYKLWRMLREDGFACRHKGKRFNVPTQKGLDCEILATAYTGRRPLAMMTMTGIRHYAQKLVLRDFPLLAS